jgi:predicted FMN-binding regulatory protein PaiB
MYQPAHGKFEVEDAAAYLAELCAVVPATLVTHGPGGFRATILPMLFDGDQGPHGMLRGHLARGNPQWREIEASVAAGGDGAGEALAIFDGPDAYISPAWYEEKRLTGKVVPTWNYATVQAHGTISTIHDPDWSHTSAGLSSATNPVDRIPGRSPMRRRTTSERRLAPSSVCSSSSRGSRPKRSSRRTAVLPISRARSRA